ncbi:MAG: sugar phosphate isomerase/epimerase family protein [Spirochaetia bacterium]|jgi:sugar phosphate isomerase/epimerase
MAYFTGFADEAGRDIDTQIRATQALGWRFIEARNVNGVNLTDISDTEFESVAAKLQQAGIAINCFGSAVANWAKDPRTEADFQKSREELKRAIPRMKRLGTRMIRGMSFVLVKDAPPDSEEIQGHVFRKVADLVRQCEDAGVLYLHENCMNYGGQSWEHTLRLLERVKSPSLRLVFDTGNPVFSFDRRGKEPYKLQSAWEFYRNVRPFIEYVHIKDGRYIGPSDGLFPKTEYTWPGEGNGEVRRIVTDLAKTGYDGGFSMEPHMTTVFHVAGANSPEETMFSNYVEYGRRFAQLAAECGFVAAR